MAETYKKYESDGVLIIYSNTDGRISGCYTKGSTKREFKYEKGEMSKFQPKKFPDGPPPFDFVMPLDTQVLIHQDCPLFVEINADPQMSSFFSENANK
mmetsp:Transcript_12515/g.10749  ORF Transcript_12515/g.10749 Transcript_12515/m.10749 type:complete len:98 (+) Transcript_12515:661-954(+)